MFFKWIREALNRLGQSVKEVSKSLEEILRLLSTTSWRIDQVLDSKKPKNEEPRYEIEEALDKLNKFARDMDMRDLSELLKNSPNTAKNLYIVLTYCDLSEDSKSELLALMRDVLLENAEQISQMEKCHIDEVEQLQEILWNYLDENANKRGSGFALLMDFMERNEDEEVVEKIGKLPGFEEQINNRFYFEDIEALDDRSVQLILREVQSDSLIMALKGTPQELQNKIFSNMSQRAAEMLKEDLENKGPVPLSEVKAERQVILGIIYRLGEEGQMILRKRGDAVVE